jgi:hypothetical protein
MTSNKQQSLWWVLLALIAVLAIGAAVYLFVVKRKPGADPGATKAPEITHVEKLNALLGAARAKVSTNDLSGGLDIYEAAEQQLTEEFRRLGGNAPTNELSKLYGQIVGGLNELVDQVETPEYEAGLPEQDLLSPQGRDAVNWETSAGVEMTFMARELLLKGIPVQGNGAVHRVVSFGVFPKNPWRDIVLKLDFTIIKGDFELLLRYSPGTRAFMLKFDAAAGYEWNKGYQVTLRVRGSKVDFSSPDQNPVSDTLRPTTNRRGGVAFVLAPEAKVILSSCMVKVLRPKGAQ